MGGRSPLPLRRAGEAGADGRERGAGGMTRASARPLRPLKRRILPAAGGRGTNADAEADDRAVASALLPVRCAPSQAALEGGPLRRRPSRHQRSQCRSFLLHWSRTTFFLLHAVRYRSDHPTLLLVSLTPSRRGRRSRCIASRGDHACGNVVRTERCRPAVGLFGVQLHIVGTVTLSDAPMAAKRSSTESEDDRASLRLME